MIVLRILGILALVLLAIGMIVLTLVMSLPARVEVKRKMPDGPLRMRIGFGPVKRIWTLSGGKKKSAQEKKQTQKQQSKKEKKLSAPRFDLERLDYDKVFELAFDLIDDFAGSMTWERLHVTVILHTPDAARTGNLLGALCAAVGNIYPYLERAFVLKDTKIVLDADFDAQKTVWGVDISVMTRLGRFPRVIWRRRKQLWTIWKAIRTTKEERAQWMHEHTAAQINEDK